jgi:hypothetical protein
MSVTSIENLYIGYFGRAADPAGLNYWLGQESAGLTDTQIAASFAVQPETMALYPSLATPALLDASPTAEANFINAIYTNLFGHAADTAGLSYWQGQLTAGVNPGLMISQIISGAQGTDTTALSSKAGVATTYTNAVLNASPAITWSKGDVTASKSILATVTSASTASATGSSISAAISADQSGSSGVTGVTLTLPSTATGGAPIVVTISPTATGTNSQQTVNGANNTIRGLGAGDLNSSVSINGGTGGLNTLNAVVANANGSGVSINPLLQNIQIVNLDPSTNNETFNASGDTGLQIVNEAGGSIIGTTGQTLTVTNLAQSVNVGMSNATAITDNLTVSFSGIAASGNAATVVLSGNSGGTFDTTLSSGNGINTYNIQSTGKANTVNIGNTDSALSSIVITGSTNLTLTDPNAFATTINGSAATGNLNITATGPGGTISGGSGNDTINAGGTTKKATLTDGNGTDTLTFNGALAGNVVNLGTGVDTVLTTQAATAHGNGLDNLTAATDNTNGTAAGTLGGDLETVNGYTSSDVLDLSGLAGTPNAFYGSNYAVASTTVESAVTTAVSNVAAGNLLNAVKAAATAAGMTVGTVAWFNYGGNEYIYQQNGANATFTVGAGNASDGLLQLTSAGSAAFKLTAANVA